MALVARAVEIFEVYTLDKAKIRRMQYPDPLNPSDIMIDFFVNIESIVYCTLLDSIQVRYGCI
jgi:hypothetical protein